MRMDNGFVQLLGLDYFFSGDVNYCDGGLVDWRRLALVSLLLVCRGVARRIFHHVRLVILLLLS